MTDSEQDEKATGASQGSPSRHAASTLAVPRSRGAITGILLIALGAWGALLPLIGPHFHFGYGPDHKTFDFTAARVWLQILPGAVALVAGLFILLGGNRISGSIAGYAAAAAGAWFVVGPTLADLRSRGYVGAALGGNDRQHLGSVAAFYGLGAVILFLAALVIGRLSVVGVRDVRASEKRHGRAEASTEEPPAFPATRDVPVTTTSVRATPAPALSSAAETDRTDTEVRDGTTGAPLPTGAVAGRGPDGPGATRDNDQA